MAVEDFECDSPQSEVTKRTLRKRHVDSPVQPNNKRRCIKKPKKHESMSQIKKLYMNAYKPPNPQNLETIFEEDADEEEMKIGKAKIRRSILFKDGMVTKMKIKHRKKMVKKLETTGFVKPKKLRLTLDAVLQRLAEDQGVSAGDQSSLAESQSDLADGNSMCVD
ncbi:hypothetical protein B566_EDAN016308 [Ephemera danica]|nr:hypothetical protein B566_EDAN016308 [Ephemera danica]